MGAPSGDADAEAGVDAQETPASFDQLLRRAAAARARHKGDAEPDQSAAVTANEGGEEMGEAGPSPSQDQPS